jgi:hypothetical protein
MPKPRKRLVSLQATPYYHCVSRCVRRAVLCGEDAHCGRSYGHRRGWIEERMKALAGVFAIDICTYAVMSNHYHVVLHVDRERAQEWDDREVIRRWQQLFASHPLTRRHLAGEPLLPVEQGRVLERVALWRSRLMDISWYMRCLNECIARQANAEDQCTGRFWEGRFRSQYTRFSITPCRHTRSRRPLGNSSFVEQLATGTGQSLAPTCTGPKARQ